MKVLSADATAWMRLVNACVRKFAAGERGVLVESMGDGFGENPVALVKRFIECESGATAIEYAMIAGTISMIILSTLLSIGQSIKGFFTAVRDGFPT